MSPTIETICNINFTFHSSIHTCKIVCRVPSFNFHVTKKKGKKKLKTNNLEGMISLRNNEN